MAIKGDYKKINREDVEKTRDTLIKTIRRTVEKSVQEAGFDKTILATVQYCTDATLGQYKIKYQDGYFTAYALDKTVQYSNKASVFVKVQNNDMTKRMHIIGLATDDSDDRKSLLNLEGDQKYGVIGSNFIASEVTAKLKMSSYEGGAEYNTKSLYSFDWPANNILNLQTPATMKQELINAAMTKDDGSVVSYFRLGAEFKTAFDDIQKTSAGNYGLIVRMAFQKEGEQNNYFKDFIIDSFSMEGTPFNFPTYTSQYNYWEINPYEFDYVSDIYMFTNSFDDMSDPPTGDEPEFDIFLKNINIQAAIKYYTTEDESYQVVINSVPPTGTIFDETERENDKLSFSASLTKLGNPVEAKGQNLRFIWGKEDPMINSVNNKKYNKYLGKGWYCLNTSYRKNYNNETFEELGDPDKYTILSTDNKLNRKTVIEWDYNSDIINIPRAICPGRTTNIKCIIVYEKIAYESTIVPITNPLGSYLIIKDDPKYEFVFRGGFGFDSITAGLFVKDYINNTINDRTFGEGIAYHWTITNPDDQKDGGTELPSKDPQSILQPSADWFNECRDKETNPYNPRDNINIDDEDVRAYYEEIEQEHGFDYKENMRLSLDRYNYYNQNFSFDNPPTEQQQNQKARIKSRKKLIINEKVAQIYEHYIENFKNDAGYYILGPSSINEGYTATDFSSTNIWYGTPGYDNKPFNTLYQIKGADIQSYLRVRVTATWTHVDNDGDTVTDTIESKEVVLRNDSTAGLDFDLDIVNGEQNFVYSTGGLSPTSDDNDQLPMAIQPLYFKFYNKNGELIFDSQKEGENSDNQNGVDINTLNPQWTLFDNQYSLIQNSYAGAEQGHYSKDDDDPRIIHVMKERKFVYDLAEKYDINLRDQSNIDLKITYQGATYYASTHFTFAKQGELGTNGTENFLGITCPGYYEFRESVLDTDERNWFITKIKNVKDKEYYPASLRHLTNAFLFATQAYDINHNPVHYINDNTAPYVNLYFAQGQGENEHTLQGARSIKLEGRWGDEAVQGELASEQTEWDFPLEIGKAISDNGSAINYECTPSFSFSNGKKGASTTLTINYLYENNQEVTPLQAYKPSLIEIGEGDDKVLKVANNVVSVTSSRDVTSIIDPDTGNPIVRKNTNYYAIPFFFYSAYDNNNATNLAIGLDPTYYIQICGGFDSITYDGGGLHPSYNQQTPFKLFFYDIEHNDITEDVIKANGVTWECSKGLTLSKNWDTNGNVKAKIYPSEFGEDEQLYGQYCKISNDGGNTYDYYKCIHKHVKGGKKKVKATGKTYNANEFVDPYWKRVNSISEGKRECYVTPAPSYDVITNQSFYNPWVGVTIRYVKNSIIYSAQIMIPINVICNRYGSEELNGWDGKRLKMGDDYMLASKVAAGIQDTDGFTGIYLGKNLYPDEGKTAVGLFGRYKGQRTLFMDAKSGRTFLGANESTQIILNPGKIKVVNGQAIQTEEHPWSRLASWYINDNFLYKPIGEGQSYPSNKAIDGLDDSFTLTPPTTEYGSIGMYCPYKENVSSQDVFLWASSKERDPDIDDVIQEMTTLQTQMAAYGVQFNSDYSPKNDQKRLKYYKDLLKRATHCLDWEQTYGTTVDVSRISTTDEDWNTWQQETGITEKDIKRSAHPSEEEVRTLIDEIYYAIEYYEIHEPKPGGWASTDEPPIVSYVSNYYATAKTDNRRVVKTLTEDIDRYDQYYSTYSALLKSISNGKLVNYKTNKKNANFYVTYGGHLHCESADVTGKIVAQTGQFGSGLNKILISTVKDGRRYVLYNKNFWVGDDDNDGETEIFMKGEIRAKSGQIGHVGDDVDGEDSRTVFIEYPWYSWHLPATNEPFNDFTYYLDKLSGKNTTYAIYHKNFSIENGGTVRLNGKIFTRSGRIGDWVINDNELKDCFDNIVLHPSNDARNPRSGWIELGLLKLWGSGAIDGTAWNITAEGEAHFTNAANSFEGNSFKVKDDVGGDLTINSQGLDIPTGGQMKIGQEILTAGEHGFNFSGGASFNQEIFTKKISVDPSQTISWGSTASDSGLTLGRNGLSFAGQGIDVQLTAGGLTLGTDITISSTGTHGLVLGTDTMVGGDTIPELIEKTIKNFLNGCSVITGYGTSEIDGQPVVTYIDTMPITTN